MNGRRLGPYEISEQLGAGGMGEVWLAEDTRLGRQVAVKVLPEEFASDPERLARFEQEARAAAALNHPHIAAVYDVGTEGEGEARVQYMVQEYLQGQTLRELLERGPLELKRAVALVTEIAEALRAAHAAGIVHRDLKPENVFVTEDRHAKVLDFGLAKLTETPSGGVGGESMSPTVLGTQTGAIMGTAGYMAPEQIQGASVDGRTDLFALGCLLYEMVTGERLFAGKNPIQALDRIVNEEPASLQGPVNGVPLRLRWLLRKLVAKEPETRCQSAADALVDLRALASDLEAGAAEFEDAASAEAASHGAGVPGWVAVALAVVALAGGWLLADALRAPASEVRTRVNATIALPEDTRLAGGHHDEERLGGQRPAEPAIAWVPDGSGVVLAARGDDGLRLYHRPLDGERAIPIAGTEGGHAPTVSPDGTSVAFVVGIDLYNAEIRSRLMRVPLAGGTARTVYTARDGSNEVIRGPRWMAQDAILFERLRPDESWGIYRVAAAGGEPEPVVVASSLPPVRFGGPGYPDLSAADGILFFSFWTPNEDLAGVYIGPQGEPPDRLIPGASSPRVWGDLLLFAREGTLLAARVDTETLEIEAGPVTVMEDVMHAVEAPNTSIWSGVAQFDVSSAGLAVARGGVPRFAPTPLSRVDRQGTGTPIGGSGTHNRPRLSPDGTRVAYDAATDDGTDLVVRELGSGAERALRLEGNQLAPAWSPDGERLAFVSTHEGGSGSLDLYVWDLSGEGAPVRVGDGVHLAPESWVDDHGVFGVLLEARETQGFAVVEVDSGEVLEELPGGSWPALSPDHRWYAHGATWQEEPAIVVRPFPAGEPAYRIAAGTRPAWSPDGRQLYYRTGRWDRETLMVVDVETAGDAFEAGAPREVFTAPYIGSGPTRAYEVLPDGTFLMSPAQSALPQPVREIQLLLGWKPEIEALLNASR